jgi:hypothetical protein
VAAKKAMNQKTRRRRRMRSDKNDPLYGETAKSVQCDMR